MLDAQRGRHQLSSGSKNRSDLFLFSDSQSGDAVLPAKQTADVYDVGSNLLNDLREVRHLIVFEIVNVAPEEGVLPFMNPLIWGSVGIISDCRHRNVHKLSGELCHVCHADSGSASFLRWVKAMREE